MKKAILIIAGFLMCGLCVSQVFAQVSDSGSGQGMVPMKATATKVQGSAVVIKAGQSAPATLRAGMALGTGDTVETKGDGMVEIRMANGNTVNLTPGSHLALTSLASDPASGEYENLMSSTAGKMRVSIAAKVTGRSTFKIKTPTAICGARGTVFYIVVGEAETRVFVTDGSVDFSNPTTGDTFVVVQDMTALASSTGTTEPVELTGADRDAVLAIYNQSLSTGPDGALGAPEGQPETVPQGPSQTDNPQTPTDNPPPSQS